jgi:hypothetical protein
VRWGVVAEADGEPNQGAEFVGEKRAFAPAAQNNGRIMQARA